MKLNRKEAPQLQKTNKLRIPNMESFSLDNGIPVWLMNTGSQEILKIQISFPAGTVFQNKALLAFFTHKMLLEGSKNYSASQIAEKLDFYGAYVDTKTSKDRAYLNVFCLTKHLDKVLEVVVDVLTQATFPEKELVIMANQEKQQHIINQKKVKTIAQRTFNKKIFGEDNVYGKLAKTSDYDLIKCQDLQGFYKQFYAPQFWSIFVSGKIEEASLNSLQKHFGQINISQKGANITNPISFTPPILEKIFIAQKGALQTAIKIGKIGLDRNHKDYAAYSLAQTILGGYFGSRLMKNIREDKGYTYGIYANTTHHNQRSVFSIFSEVGSNVAKEALKEIQKELKILRTKEVGNQELQLVKNYISGSLLRSLNGPFSLGEMMRMLKENSLPDDYFTQHINDIQNTTANDILNVCNQYLHEEKMLSIMVGS